MNSDEMVPESLSAGGIYNMDCIEGMARIAPESVDLVITDPPFAIDFKPHRGNYNRTQSRVMQGYREFAADEYLEFSRAWMNGVRRVLKPSGSLFIFSGWNNLKDILIAADEIGYTTVNHIIWKYQFGVVCKRRFVTSHYHCLYLCANDAERKFHQSARFGQDDRSSDGRSLRYRDMEDVWDIKREYWHGDRKTPTKLPAELIEKILQYTSDENDLVMDPFLGSGQVAVVSKSLNRQYIGFEIVEEYYRFARERLATGQYRLSADEDSPQQSN